MLILPALDLIAGRCVRLLKGEFSAVTEYGDPLEQIEAFAAAGATWAHVVDLDGAKARAPAQLDLIARLAAATPVKLQVGGGVRRFEDVTRLLEAGAARVVIGSAAARTPALVRTWIEAVGAERMCCAFDVRPVGAVYLVSADGWTADTGLSLEDALAHFAPGGLRHVLVTDISRDGALTGPNVALVTELAAKRADLAVQASGGVARLEDIATLRAGGAAGAIVGRALYERRFTLEQALAG